jgi:hypothetical protein
VISVVLVLLAPASASEQIHSVKDLVKFRIAQLSVPLVDVDWLVTSERALPMLKMLVSEVLVITRWRCDS